MSLTNTSVLSEENARSREGFFEAVEKAVQKAAQKFELPVTIDLDERGSAPRYSISVRNQGNPGIIQKRRYGNA